MQLASIAIQRFRNFDELQVIDVEEDVTCLLGKNESGKTTILKALHRLHPANGTDVKFDLTTEYPRWRLAEDRRAADLGDLMPVSAVFRLDEEEAGVLGAALDLALPPATLLKVGRTYDNELRIEIEIPASGLVNLLATANSVSDDDADALRRAESVAGLVALAGEMAVSLKVDAPPRAAAVAKLAKALPPYSRLEEGLGTEQFDVVKARIPRFFYFSNYDVLPGEADLQVLSEKIATGETLKSTDRTVVALLDYAGVAPKDFLEENYDSRKAELQSAGLALSAKVFKYWKQNTDLAVRFDTDMPVFGRDANGAEIRHRTLKIELQDGRHGGVETNFSTRSAGFQWFFSFLAAFSAYSASKDPVIVLLDEPGTSLHGEAQRDFLGFIYGELGPAQQVIYSTHSQHMIDTTKYEKLRAVHDRATREDPGGGVSVERVSLSADKETVLPIEAALGYSVAQHLFIGGGEHLLVEGSSDFVYLTRMSQHLTGLGRQGLRDSTSIIPVGGSGNMPAFVALMGRRLDVTVLLDGEKARGTYDRVKAAAEANDVAEDKIVLCWNASPGTLPIGADIEDLFDPEDYLALYSATIGSLAIADLGDDGKPILRRIEVAKGKFDHAVPAHYLQNNWTSIVSTFRPATLNNFEALFTALTIPARGKTA